MRDELSTIEEVGHRDFVGGLWDEIGRLQLQFLVDQGLRPHHVLLDIGCGALRGGVHFIPYLDRGRYLGIDKHGVLIRLGLEVELDPGVRARRAPELVVCDSFGFESFSKQPDYAIAQSLFTHLDKEDIRLCLRRLRAFARPGCRFFATYFEAAEPASNPAQSCSTLRFDYSAEELLELGESEGWRASGLGDWGHPRGQRMLLFETPPPPARRRPVREPTGCVSVAIPVWNGGERFARCLEAVAEQEGVRIQETIVIDSGSTDGTQEVARATGARVVEIPQVEFNHGTTRNRLAELAIGDTILFLVHDAILGGPSAMRLLVEELEADPSMAAVSARQRPGPDADLYGSFDVWLHDELTVSPRLQGAEGPVPGGDVDNVCAAVRRSAWEQLPFRRMLFGEDADFGARALAAGWRTAFSAEAVVYHHHDRNAAYALGRAVHDRLELAGVVPLGEVTLDPRVGRAALQAGCRQVLRELSTAVEWAIGGAERVSLRGFVERLAATVAAGAPLSDLRGELALTDEVLSDADLGHVLGTPAARAQVRELLEWPLVATWAGTVTEPVAADAARVFAARLTAAKLGWALGEIVRRKPDPEFRDRLAQVYGTRGARPQTRPARSAPDPRGAAGQAIAVLGMHRSGTSLTAGVLNLLGISFGEEESMLPPQPDNPRGYREQRPVLDLNDDLLAAFGRVWTDPRGLPAGWESAPELGALEERARAVVEDLYGDLRVWGVKDPRLSILLPFWLRVVPGMRFVVCVRNPVDVVRSLEAREGPMDGAGPDLWLLHTASALRDSAGRQRLVLEVEDLFDRPEHAVGRLAAFAGASAAVEPAVRARVEAFLEGGLWHHRSSTADVVCDPGIPAEAKLLYLWLRGEHPPALPGLPEALADGLAESRTRLAAADAEVAELRGRLDESERTLEQHIGWLNDVQGSASWRITEPLRDAKRRTMGRRDAR